jgi:GT2 family glycosyltransferase
MKKVTVIIPYKIDRGWLTEAIMSVPTCCQLIVSRGDGNWPQNFNKAIPKITGDYVRYLHEDDLLSPHSIEKTLEFFEQHPEVDFVHGKAVEFYEGTATRNMWRPGMMHPTLPDMLKKNYLHSVTLVYKREIFEKIGGFNEDPKMYSFEEFEFNLRVLYAGFNIGYIDSVLGFYRRHPNQIIRTVDKQVRNENRAELIREWKTKIHPY